MTKKEFDKIAKRILADYVNGNKKAAQDGNPKAV